MNELSRALMFVRRRPVVAAGVLACAAAGVWFAITIRSSGRGELVRTGELNRHQPAAGQVGNALSNGGNVKELQRLIRKEIEQGRYDAALAACDRLAIAAPRDPLSWSARGFIHEQRFESARAAEAYRQALQRNPHTAAEIRHRLISMLLALGRTGEARRQMEKLMQQVTDPAPYALTEAFLCRIEGNRTGAETAIDRFLERYPRTAGALMLRGTLRYERGDYEVAVEDLTAAVEQTPDDRRAHYKLARALQRADRPELAERHFAASRRLAPKRPSTEQ